MYQLLCMICGYVVIFNLSSGIPLPLHCVPHSCPLVLSATSLLFFRLAAETLAGLDMQPRSSQDQPRSASAGLDDSSDDSPPLPTRRLSKHPAVAKQRTCKMEPIHKPAVHSSSAAAPCIRQWCICTPCIGVVCAPRTAVLPERWDSLRCWVA